MFTTPRGRCCRSCSSASRASTPCCRGRNSGSVKQRVSRHVRLEPLGIAELSQYIDHRLAVARNGAASSHGAVTFAPEALSAIWRLSGGTPRVINLLCDRALEAAYEKQAHSVGGPLVDAAAAELGLSTVRSCRGRAKRRDANRRGANARANRRGANRRGTNRRGADALPSVRRQGTPGPRGRSRRCPSRSAERLGLKPPHRRGAGFSSSPRWWSSPRGPSWFGVRALYPSGQSARLPPAEQAVTAAPPSRPARAGCTAACGRASTRAPAPSPATSAAAPYLHPRRHPLPRRPNQRRRRPAVRPRHSRSSSHHFAR